MKRRSAPAGRCRRGTNFLSQILCSDLAYLRGIAVKALTKPGANRREQFKSLSALAFSPNHRHAYRRHEARTLLQLAAGDVDRARKGGLCRKRIACRSSLGRPRPGRSGRRVPDPGPHCKSPPPAPMPSRCKKVTLIPTGRAANPVSHGGIRRLWLALHVAQEGRRDVLQRFRISAHVAYVPSPK